MVLASMSGFDLEFFIIEARNFIWASVRVVLPPAADSFPVIFAVVACGEVVSQGRPSCEYMLGEE